MARLCRRWRGLDPLRPSDPGRQVFDPEDDKLRRIRAMDVYQQIAELAAELAAARLTKLERADTIRRLHELQHDLELAEVDAIDSGDRVTAEHLFDQWQRIEDTLGA
jgi:hypothetical protein